MIQEAIKIAGIDYGSKQAGTTVIAFLNEKEQVAFTAAEKKQDADRFILEWAKIYQPRFIFLDAPLSLPGVYRQLPDCRDYFYRSADRAVQAMSPMFLGGLTARAMQLQANLEKMGIQTMEVYPAHLVKLLNLDKNLYKKQKEHLATCCSQLTGSLGHLISAFPTTWHHFDALLALFSGIRYLQNEHLTFGDPSEGVIMV